MAAANRVLEDSDVFVGFLCLYLLTAGRSPPSGDAVPMWQAAENLVRHGSFAIDLRWPVNAPRGVGGHFYPVAALLACLIHVPGALLHVLLSTWSPERGAQFAVVTSQLGPMVVGALVPTQFFRLLRQMGYPRRTAAWTTVLLGTGTSVWVYAHRPYSEILQVACFLAFYGALLRAADTPTRAAWWRLGFAFGLLINAKNIYFVCLPGAVAYGYWRLRDASRPRPEGGDEPQVAQGNESRNHRARIRTAAVWAGVGAGPGLLGLAWYNVVRWGSVTESGYGGAVTAGFWGEHMLVGLWGQFLSPGKSVFLYAPPLLLSLWGMRRFWARQRAAAVAILLLVAPVVLLYARYLFWSGDWGWGPRYLVFALPLLTLPAAELFGATPSPGAAESLGARPVLTWSARIARMAFVAVWFGGVLVQALGNAFHWDDFINISRQAQQAWLGRPDTRGTVLAPDPCFSCFEEVYPVQWLPPMQPIAGHWWLLRHKIVDDDWRAAEADAPWKRYTSLTVDIEGSYGAAGVDWWPFAAEPGRRWPVVLVASLLLLAIPFGPWRRALRGVASDVGSASSPSPPRPRAG